MTCAVKTKALNLWYFGNWMGNRTEPKLENRKTSQCSPCAPNLLHVLPSRMVGWNELCNPAVRTEPKLLNPKRSAETATQWNSERLMQQNGAKTKSMLRLLDSTAEHPRTATCKKHEWRFVDFCKVSWRWHLGKRRSNNWQNKKCPISPKRNS